MTSRPFALQRVLDLSEMLVGAAATADAGRAAARVFDRMRDRCGVVGGGAHRSLPVVEAHLCTSLDVLAGGNGAAPALAGALRALAPELAWDRRKTSTPANQPFHDGHANATLAGPGGYEQREDVWVGATLMAPGIVYPDHDHPPEEVYLALSEGEWWNAAMDWTSPGLGGIIYNPPGILHAIRSHASPFLALWFLPLD
jgi:hypothetical protein